MLKLKDGFVLFITITILSVLSILIFSLLNFTVLSSKVINQLANSQNLFYKMEELSLKFSKDMKYYIAKCSSKSISISQLNANIIFNKGCRFIEEKFQYYYIFSDLGVFSCLEIEIEKIKYDSHHWILSIFDANYPEKIFYYRIAKPNKISSCDSYLVNRTKSGIINRW